MKKLVFILAVVLVLTFVFAITASAKQPAKISGFFYFVPPYGDDDYCISTGENYESDGFLEGCVDQLENPGIGAHGTMFITLDPVDSEPLTGICKYNLRTYDIDDIARFVANRCTGDLAGFHMKAVGWAFNGLWEGSYHFHP
jgi:hypothetical protein